MKHYSRAEARKKFSELMNRVVFENSIISIGRGQKTEAYLIPKPDLASNIPISKINAQSDSFAFLDSEPDIYELDDLNKRYV